MNGYNFTDRVRKSLMFAREEAFRLHHEYVGTEHILLGLLLEGAGVASAVLSNLKADPETIRQKVLEIVKAGQSGGPAILDLPYTSRAKRVLELSMSEARELGHSYVGTEHVLLGLIREEKGIAAQVLAGLGITGERARAETVSVLGDHASAGKALENPGFEAERFVVHTVIGAAGARLLLSISAGFAGAIGLMLIFNARALQAPMGIAVDDWTETIAQAQGAVLLGLGIINWLSRGVTDRAALWAILYGNFVVQLVSFAIVARALARGLIPAAGFGALALHIVLGAAFAWHLIRMRRM
jgi:hypothetical protein